MMSPIAKALFRKEFSSYFKGPVAYVFLAIFWFGTGYLAFEAGRGSFFNLRQASMSAYFQYIPWMFVFLIPAVSMRLWSEERKSGTIELLLSLPIRLPEAVLSKFLAAWCFLAVALLGSLPMLFTVTYLGQPDLGVILFGYLASFFLAGVLLAIGNFFSVMSKNQVVSFILSVCVSFLLLMAGSPPVLEFVSGFSPKYVVELFEALSVLNRFEAIQRGVFSLADLWFFLVMMGFWLLAGMALLSENKANG